MNARRSSPKRASSREGEFSDVGREAWEAEVAELTYNQARTALQLVIGQLQSEDLEVECMADLYRRALAYTRRCEAVLQEVNQEIIQMDPSELESQT